MSPTTRRATIWSAFIIGLVLLLWGLAKLGASGPSTTVKENQKLTVPTSVEDWFKGDPKAPVSIVEYSDFQCPACKVYYPIIRKLNEDLGDKLLIVYRHFPLRQVHKNAAAAAEAAEAAGLQGKFWEMHNALFDTQDNWAKDENPAIYFEDLASSLKLDTKKFKDDMKSAAVKNKINRDYSSGANSGVDGTPTFFLNDKLIPSPRSYDEFKKLIEQSATATSGS